MIRSPSLQTICLKTVQRPALSLPRNAFSFIIFSYLFFPLPSFGQGRTQALPSKPAQENAQSALYELFDKDVTHVNFARGGSALTEAELRNIQAFYKSASSEGHITRIMVTAWADRVGQSSGDKLFEGQVRLAQKRAEAITKVLSELSGKPLSIFNAADDINWLEKAFPRKRPDMESTAKDRTKAQDNHALAVSKTIEDKGGPGRALVIIERQHQTNATSGR